jgi:tRNA modification GTPase
MNALAGRDVAIISPIPGTTRDLIEVFLDLRGYPVILVDTAGIRESHDPIEQEGVARARRKAESADLTLWLNDDGGVAAPSVASPILLVRTKIDLSGQSTLAENQQMPLAPPPPVGRSEERPSFDGLSWGRDGVGGRADHADKARSGRRRRDPPPGLPHKGGGESTRVAGSANLAISAKTGAGIDRLLDAIADLAEERMSSREPALLTLERHRRGFQDARQALASTLAPDSTEPELIAEDLRRAALAMDHVVGRIGVEDVLGEIFARLCVGK